VNLHRPWPDSQGAVHGNLVITSKYAGWTWAGPPGPRPEPGLTRTASTPRPTDRSSRSIFIVEIIMTIVVGYVPTTEGEVVLASPAEEVRLPSQRLIVVSSSRGESSLAPAQPRTSAVSRLVAEVKIAGAAVDVDEKEKRPGRRDPRSRREVGASLVVVGLKNRSANGKLMLGTTAQTIMLKVPCSVIGLGA